MSIRLDNYLVENSLVPTRSQARMLIKKGDVLVNKKNITKPGFTVSINDLVEVAAEKTYVSRGGYKLEFALKESALSLEGKVVMDIGASTGGFTQVALDHGAQKVYAIDVGHDQLAEELKNDPRVINMEGVNAKNEFALPEKCDALVMDVSFISVRHLMPNLLLHLKKGAHLFILLKPQFEVGREHLGKNGIVKDEKIRDQVIADLYDYLEGLGLKTLNRLQSPLTGKQGNVEFLGCFTFSIIS
jgi:23S rRNA (cytidine1920-2'-O)/16S rRNA (cytidine1409-2'-O)-methyltransferase